MPIDRCNQVDDLSSKEGSQCDDDDTKQPTIQPWAFQDWFALLVGFNCLHQQAGGGLIGRILGDDALQLADRPAEFAFCGGIPGPLRNQR